MKQCYVGVLDVYMNPKTLTMFDMSEVIKIRRMIMMMMMMLPELQEERKTDKFRYFSATGRMGGSNLANPGKARGCSINSFVIN